MMTSALRYTPSATLAPLQYLEIPFTTVVGWLIFHELPGGIAATGIVIIVVSGLYIVFRERAAATPIATDV
jgi:drug/metabolite transporter (DMT)-like permease